MASSTGVSPPPLSEPPAHAWPLEALKSSCDGLADGDLDPGGYAQARPCEWTSGPMLVRASALQWVGWFDERLFHLAAEIDLCQRLRRAGWEVFNMPCLTVRRHEPPPREAALLESQAAYGRMQFARKHFPHLAADYRWALARCALLRRPDGSRRQAARTALSTVFTGRVPLAERSAL